MNGMPAPLSNDIRKRILALKERGYSHRKISQELQVSISAITRLLTLYRETGRLEPRALHNSRKPHLDEETLQKIRQKIEEQPDISLQELIKELSLPVSALALCKTINNKLGLRRKKTVYAAEQSREDVKTRRKEWQAFQANIDSSKLIFWIRTALTQE